MVTIQAVGIIAEYNPFHNGHCYHAAQAKKHSGCEYCIAVMSGQFTQRGEPAAFDKWTRAEMAVAGGVDLVIELPVVFAVRSAQYFAAGGVRLLASLGVVTHLAFGSENPDQKLLQQAADWADTEIGPILREKMSSGVTYAAAFADCLAASGASTSILSQPNNILAIEYLRAIKQYAETLAPVIIPRRSSHYHDINVTSPYASATAVREALIQKKQSDLLLSLPPASLSIINQRIADGCGPISFESLALPILYKLRTSSLECLADLPDVGEGLHHKLASAALKASTVKELLNYVKSKRYPMTRLQRTLIHALLSLSKQQIAAFDIAGPQYIRVLSFNRKGRLLLQKISEQPSIPVITKTTQFLSSKQRYRLNELSLLQQMLTVDTIATDIYALASPNDYLRQGANDFLQSPVYVSHQQPAIDESGATPL